MDIPATYKNKFFFHFTHIDNLQEILTNGLLSTNEKTAKKVDHLDIASPDIQCTRHEMEVTCGPMGHVHDYVPFYFCARTPIFLSIIKSRNYDQPYFIHFAVSTEKLKSEKFVFTNKAANRKHELPDFYECPSKLTELNWSSIESKSWGCPNDTEKHEKMAEALHFGKFDLDDIDYIVVWNDAVKDHVIEIFEKNKIKCPPIKFEHQTDYYHHYGDLNCTDNHSLVHGPKVTLSTLGATIDNITKAREVVKTSYQFEGIDAALIEIRKDFKCVAELKAIIDLPTDNKVHKENVEDHTRSVVNNLVTSAEYRKLSVRQQLIVELAAFLHDIGKGPKSRWPDGKQKVDDDHPRKSATYLERILINDIKNLTDEDVRQIVLLVLYHDFFGDHLVAGRFIAELKNVITSKSDLEMLYALAKADVSSIHLPWYSERISEWENAYDEILGFLND